MAETTKEVKKVVKERRPNKEQLIDKTVKVVIEHESLKNFPFKNTFESLLRDKLKRMEKRNVEIFCLYLDKYGDITDVEFISAIIQ